MYTQHGLQQRKNLENIANIGENMLAALRPIVEKVPGIVIKRVKDTGSGASGKFIRTHTSGTPRVGSPYHPDWAKRRSNSGLQTGKKDFWFDGKMWGSFVILKEEVTTTGISFTLGGNNADAHNGGYLIDIHSDNQGQNILDITDEEWEKIENALFRKFAENIKL